MKKTTTNKIQVQVVAGAPQFDVSDFPENVERSKGKGAVYFRPNTILGLTEGEVEHVKAQRPDMLKYLVISEIKKPTEEQLKARMAAKAKVKAKAEEDAKAETEKAEAKANAEAEEKARQEEEASKNRPTPPEEAPQRSTKGNNPKNKKR